MRYWIRAPTFVAKTFPPFGQIGAEPRWTYFPIKRMKRQALLAAPLFTSTDTKPHQSENPLTANIASLNKFKAKCKILTVKRAVESRFSPWPAPASSIGRVVKEQPEILKSP